MKIVLAHNLYEPFAKGGAEKVVQKMADDFLEEGHEVVVISTKPKTGKYIEKKQISDNYKAYYISSFYHELPKKNKLKRAFLLANNFCNFKKRYHYKKILKEEKPQLIITHNLIGLGFYLNKVASSLNIEQEHFIHDIQLLHPSGLMIVGNEKMIDSFPARIYQFFCKYYFKKTAKIISPSKWLLNLHQEKGFFKNKDYEIRPLRKVKAISEDAKINKNNKQFIFVGQLEEHKGLFFLINTFKKLNDNEARLVIIGKGEAEAKAKSLTKEDSRISFLGYLSSQEIKNISKKAHALIVPSLCYENSPTVIYEANELNLKVIASNIGGIKEIIKDNDLLFKAANEKDLLEKIQETLS